MKYLINSDDKTITDRILDINNVSLDTLDVSNFYVDYKQPILLSFISKLEEYKNLKFLIVGDYDCDGICATTIMKKLLLDLHIEHNYYIPSRSKEGYGLNNNIVDTAITNNFDVLLLVDNGVKALEQISYAHDNNIKVMIIDHHEYDEIVDVEAFLHPNLFPNQYSDMCAAGLCCLLSNAIRPDAYTTVLGGIATLADMVTVFNYNRYLIKMMLSLLNENNYYQINLLSSISKYDYDDLSFNVIPKINAVSRLDEYMNVNMLVKYLLADEDYCIKNAVVINNINDSRKKLTKTMSIDALKMIDKNKKFIIVKSKEFKEGLCGLIANKIMNDYHVPVIVFAYKDNVLVGSGRSPAGFNLYEYLMKCESIFDAYGGHLQAIGLSIREDNLQILEKYIESNPFDIKEETKTVLAIDKDDIDFKLLDEINRLKPYGTGFLAPSILVNNVSCLNKYIIAGKYPKFFVNNVTDAISFNSNDINKQFNCLIGKLKKDDYHSDKLSILIEDLI